MIPKIRFANYIGEWDDYPLSEIVERVTRKNKDNQTDIPLTISSLDGLVDQRDYFKKTVASKDMSGYFLLNNGEFAYNKSYSVGFDYGSIKRLDKYSCGALSTLYICFALKQGVDVDSDYLVHYFDSQKWNPEVAAICAEGARNHGLLNVPTADFFEINIDAPSLPEQRKIAALLSSVDDVITAQAAEVAAWEERKKGVMQKLFSQEVRFKADDGSEYPAWEEKTLGELGYFVRGLSYDKNQVVSHTGTLVLRSNNIGDDGVLNYVNDVQFVTKNPSAEQVLRSNDIVICMANGSDRLVGKTARYDGNCSNSCITVGAFCGIFRSDSYVLSWWFQTEHYKRFLYEARQGGDGALANLKGSEIEAASLLYPVSSDEQRKIADCLSSLDEVIAKAKDELAAWQELKKGLLQQMFV